MLAADNTKLQKKMKSLEKKATDQLKENRYLKLKCKSLDDQLKIVQLQMEKMEKERAKPRKSRCRSKPRLGRAERMLKKTYVDSEKENQNAE